MNSSSSCHHVEISWRKRCLWDSLYRYSCAGYCREAAHVKEAFLCSLFTLCHLVSFLLEWASLGERTTPYQHPIPEPHPIPTKLEDYFWNMVLIIVKISCVLMQLAPFVLTSVLSQRFFLNLNVFILRTELASRIFFPLFCTFPPSVPLISIKIYSLAGLHPQ